MLGCEVFQHVCASGIGTGFALFAAFKAHLVKQDFTQLFGRAYVKGMADNFVDFRL